MPTTEEFNTPGPAGVDSYTKRFPFEIAIVAYHERDIIMWLLKADWRIAFLDKNALVIIKKSLIPKLPKEALAEDVSIKRFSDVSNPAIFRTLFNFYVHLSPQFGREIAELYQKNVRTIYRHRDADINFMYTTIAQKEAELQKKAVEAKK